MGGWGHMAESLKVLFCNQDLDLEFCNAKLLSLGSSSSSTTAARASERASESFHDRVLKEAANEGPGRTGTP